MASSIANKLSFLLLLLLLLLLTFLHTTLARDSQFFNKASSSAAAAVTDINTKNVNQNNEEPVFLPETESGYGLFSHESAQIPTTTETTATVESGASESDHKYLPKNYDPVAYVTVPEDAADVTFTENLKDKEYDDARRYYNNDRPQEFQTGDDAAVTIGNNGYDRKRSSETRFTADSEPVEMSDTKFTENAAMNRRENYFQGISDTTSMEDSTGNYPYQSLKTTNEELNSNYYGNKLNPAVRRFQNQYEFDDEETLP